MFSFAKKLKDKLEGGTASKSDPDSYFQCHLSTNNGGYGLRVLYVAPESQAQHLQLEAFFDFIVGINGHDLPMKHPLHTGGSYKIGEDGSFHYGHTSDSAEASMVDFDLLAQELAMVASGPDKNVELKVWSAKGGITRPVWVNLAPVEKSQGATPEYGQVFELYRNIFAEIGATVASQHLNNATQVWKILNSHQNSPAFHAQLVPHSDYIIGCDSAFPSDQNGKGLLSGGGEQLLAKVLAGYYNRHYETLQDDRIPIILHVYNHDFDVVRPVTVYLSRAWAPGQNRGILGCDVGYGLLHRLPEVLGKYGPFEDATKGGDTGANVATEEDITAHDDAPVFHEKTDFSGASAPASPIKSKASNRYAPDKGAESVSENTGSFPSVPENHHDSNQNILQPNEESPISPEVDEVEKVPASDSAIKDETVEIPAYSAEKGDSSVSVPPEPQAENETTAPISQDLSIAPTEEILPSEHSAPAQPKGLSEGPVNIEDQERKDIETLEPESLTFDEDFLSEVKDSQAVDGPDFFASLTNDAKEEDETKVPVEESQEKPHEFPEAVAASDNVQDLTSEGKQEPPISAQNAQNLPVTEPENTIAVSELEAIPPVTAETEITTHPAEVSKIDSLLDEDEDFLDHTENAPPQSSKVSEIPKMQETVTQKPKVADDPTMCEIPLTESTEAKSTDLKPPQSPKTTETPVPKPMFSPMKVPTPSANAPIPKPGRRRKVHPSGGSLGSLADFMNEELLKSKAKDVSYGAGADDGTNGIPPPPKSVKR